MKPDNLDQAKNILETWLSDVRNAFESGTYHITVAREVAEQYIKVPHDNQIEVQGVPLPYWLAAARDGSKVAHEVLSEVLRCFTEREVPIPRQSLQVYAASLIDGKKIKRGSDPLKNFNRDSIVSTAVAILVETGAIAATRNDATRDKDGAECACSIVADMLNDLGMTGDGNKPFTERGVVAILQRHKTHKI